MTELTSPHTHTHSHGSPVLASAKPTAFESFLVDQIDGGVLKRPAEPFALDGREIGKRELKSADGEEVRGGQRIWLIIRACDTGEVNNHANR